MSQELRSREPDPSPPIEEAEGRSGTLTARRLAVEEIVRRLQAGSDAEADFVALFDHFYGPLTGFFSRRGFSSTDCQDLTQEVFLAVYRSLPSYRWEAPFQVWLYRLASNVLLKRLRGEWAQKRRGEETSLDRLAGEEDASESGDWGPVAHLLAGERREWLRHAVARLPAGMRRCVQLQIEHDLSCAEIASVLKISENTVRVQLFRARKRLQEQYGDDPDAGR